MSGEINNHVILNHIDKPSRFLFWSVDQVIVCLCPFFAGMIIDHIVLGIVFSVIASVGFKIFKKKFGKSKVRSILYWHLPTSERLVNKGLPPSHVRLWIK